MPVDSSYKMIHWQIFTFHSPVVLPTFHVQPHVFDLVRFLGQVFPKLQQHNPSSAEEYSACLNIEFKENFLNLVSAQVENKYWLQCYLIVTFFLHYVILSKAVFLMNLQKTNLCWEEIIKTKFSPINQLPTSYD